MTITPRQHRQGMQRVYGHQLCKRLKENILQHDKVLEMERNLLLMKNSLEARIKEDREEFLKLDDGYKFRKLGEFKRYIEDEDTREDNGTKTQVTHDLREGEEGLGSKELEALQDEVDDENDTFFDCVDVVYLKDRNFELYDKVVVTGGTKYGNSQICTIEKEADKMPLLMDADGRTFRKDKKYIQKVQLLTKNTRYNWMVDD